MMKERVMIGVIGGGVCDEDTYNTAYDVGRLVALKKGILICGGLGGVMEAAAKGAKENGGLTIGIIPTSTSKDANEFIDIPIVTNMGDARNVIITLSSDVIIAIDGKYGTLSEIAFTLKNGKHVICLNSWQLDDSLFYQNAHPVFSAEEAVVLAFDLVQRTC